MRRRRDDTAQIGQLLFARKRHLRRLKRIGHGVHLGHDPARIDPEKDHRNHDRHPEAEKIDVGHPQDEALFGSERDVEIQQQRDDGNGRGAQEHC